MKPVKKQHPSAITCPEAGLSASLIVFRFLFVEPTFGFGLNSHRAGFVCRFDAPPKIRKTAATRRRGASAPRRALRMRSPAENTWLQTLTRGPREPRDRTAVEGKWET